MKVELQPSMICIRTIHHVHGSQPFFSGSCPFGQLLRAALLEPADHIFLSADLFLLFFKFAKLRFPAHLSLRSIKAVISFVYGQFMVFYFKNTIYRLIQEVPVMGY